MPTNDLHRTCGCREHGRQLDPDWGRAGALLKGEITGWRREEHGEGTKVMRRSDGRRGVSTMKAERHNYSHCIKARWDDDGSV